MNSLKRLDYISVLHMALDLFVNYPVCILQLNLVIWIKWFLKKMCTRVCTFIEGKLASMLIYGGFSASQVNSLCKGTDPLSLSFTGFVYLFPYAFGIHIPYEDGMVQFATYLLS